MRPPYWVSQNSDKPLFPELEWSRPENRLHAGKLLVIGGNLHGFVAPAEAYNEAMAAGIGTVHALLPDAVRKLVSGLIEHVDFAPSTPSGSFSQSALSDLLEHSAWSDGVLVAGDLGRNSETAILLETFLTKQNGRVALTKDAVDYVVSAPQRVAEREGTLLILSLAQLQRLAIAVKYEKSVQFSMDLLHLVEWLHGFTTTYKPYLIVKHLDHVLVAVHGQVSTTKLEQEVPIWRIKTAAHASVWWLQHPGKPFEAITTACHDILKT